MKDNSTQIHRLIEMLTEVAANNPKGVYASINLKMTVDGAIHIRPIAGISVSGFEGICLSDGEDEYDEEDE